MLSLAAAAAVMGLAGTASADTYNWIGPAGAPAAWEDTSHWSATLSGTLPGPADNAFINNSGIATLSSDQSVNIVGAGANGTGTVTQTSGILSVGDDLFVGGQVDSTTNPMTIISSGTGTYNLDGGTVTTTFDFFVGASGQGTLNVSNGTLDAKRYLRIGETPGSVGSVVQSGGLVKGTVLMGGVGTSNSASYTMNGGTLTPTDMFLGWKGTGATFTMNDGVINGASHIRIGEDVGSSGTFNMNGGTATFPAYILVGHFAPAGTTTPTVGRLNITGGTISGTNFNVGQHPGAQGIVTQTGGTSNATANLVVGEISRQNNLYDISAGVLNVKNTTPTGTNGSAYIGSGDGIGELRVSGTGDVNIDSNLTFGGGSNSIGTFNMSGGTVDQLGVDGDGVSFTYFGANGRGSGNISGGALTTNWIIVGNANNATSRGQVTQTAGSVHAKTSMTVGNSSGNDNFYDVSGGNLDVDFNLRVARFSTSPSLGAVKYSNGRLTIGGTASVNVGGELSNSQGWIYQAPDPTPTDPNNGDTPPPEPLPGGTGLIEMKGGTLTAGSFLNGSLNPNTGGASANYVQTGGTASVGHVTGTGTVSVSGGTMNVGSLRQGSATVSSAGSVKVAPNSTSTGMSVVKTLAIAGDGKLDLTDNKLITDTPAGTASGGAYTDGSVHRMVQNAYAGGAWTGPGLTTSMADAKSGLTTLAILTGEQYGSSTFMGESITPTSTIVMYTYGGDSNLDGKIDADDYGSIDFNILVPGSSGYGNGDFNYDGVINADDYGSIDFNILAQGAPFPAGGAAAALTGVTAVPEPTWLGAGALAMLALRRRCRRRCE